ncbi:MAG: hypothetical protein QXI90_08005 [Thermofilum sp.]|uniref:PTS EIIA type-4 domain-containing protein n=1 Tax=Thermofilum pendens TaxID=2269 RepID=A0A7C4D2S4_THEPE
MRHLKYVLAAHGRLGCAMLEATAMILGISVYQKAACVDLQEGESLENFYDKLSSIVDGDTVIVTDLFGGTPSRAALMLLQEARVKAVVTGLNMPMLLEMLMNDEGVSDLPEFLQRVRQAAREGVRVFASSDLAELPDRSVQKAEKGILQRFLRR